MAPNCECHFYIPASAEATDLRRHARTGFPPPVFPYNGLNPERVAP